MTYNIVYLGRYGSGPKITLDFSLCFNKICKSLGNDYKVKVFISSKNSILEDYKKSNLSIKVFDLDFSSFKVFLNIIKLFFSFIRELFKIKDKNVFIFTMTHPLNFFLMLFIKVFSNNSKIFNIIHDPEIHPGEKKAFLKKGMSLFEIFFSDVLCALSNTSKEILKNKYKDKYIVDFPHGFIDYGSESIPRKISDRIRLLFIGRIVEYKGIDILFDSFKYIKDNNLIKNISLTIAGSGDIQRFIKKEDIKKYEINLINKYLSDQEIVEILDLHDLIILPYTSASQSGVIGLSICKGIPVIATPVGGLKDQCENKGFAILLDDISSNSLTKAILKIFHDKLLYENMSRSAIELQGEYSWEIGVKKIINFYKHS